MANILSMDPPNTLQWDFHKTVQNKDSQIIHYYDNYAQELWPTSTGLKTVTTKIDQGHWSPTIYDEEPIDIDKFNYTQLKSDHPTNGVLYMTTINGGKLEFIRYQYMMDISFIIDNWRQQFKNDSPISDLSVQLQNIGIETFMGDASLFIPGSKIETFSMFNRTELMMGVYWVDDISYDQSKDTVAISSRNYCGHYLNDQTMDELTKVEGTHDQCIKQLFEHAGITDYIIQDGFTNINKYTFDPQDTVLQAIEKVINSARNPEPNLEMVLMEHQSGRLLYGRRNWMDQYMANGYYKFDEGEDLFVRSTEKCLDGSYSRLMITGEIPGSDPKAYHTPIFVDVNNFKYWYLKKHRTKHIETPTPMSANEFKSFADSMALAFQYVGVNEDFTGPYRPQLYIGDVAEVLSDDGITGTSLGLINQITHNFSKDEGFTTDFVVDSGGVATEGDDYIVYSTSGNDYGRNRRMNMVDVIKVLTGK